MESPLLVDVDCALSAPRELSSLLIGVLLALVLLLLAVVSLLAESSRLESLLGGLVVESLLELLAGVGELLAGVEELLGLKELLFEGVELLLEEVVVDEEEDEVELSAGEAEVTGLLVEGVDDEALLG